jgi:pimeloyl-ACP methyl ester carboxylesterase
MLRHQTVRTRRGNDIAFTVIGPPGGGTEPPVFFVHPINLRKECWLGLVPRLANDRLCVAIDLTGHGESNDDPDFSLAAWTSDCVDVATALGLPPFHVVGGSLGGTIALCVAADLPDQVLSATAMGAYLGDPGDGDSELLGMVERHTVEDLFAILAREAVAPGSPDTLIATVQHQTNRHGKEIVRAVLKAANAADASTWLPRLRRPTLILTGEHDASCTPADAERLAAAAGGRYEVLDGLGHLPMLEAPETLLRVLLPHFAGARPAS